MKYICLGYIQPRKFENMSEKERHAMLDECFDYDDKLWANGHFAAGEALQPPDVAMTLYWKNGKVAVTDGPYAETKEQLGGILVLETRDLNHAIQLISQHPGVKYGPWEIRPAADLNGMIWESDAAEERARDDEHSAKHRIKVYDHFQPARVCRF
jgi:hypothetical protein